MPSVRATRPTPNVPQRTASRPDAFPKFGPVRVTMDLTSRDWTVFPGNDGHRGSPLELRFKGKDYVEISSDGRRLIMKPHYHHSSWDKFTIDEKGKVKVTALKGLFPFTLGKQELLRPGVLATLEEARRLLERSDPKTAKKLGEALAKVKPPTVKKAWNAP